MLIINKNILILLSRKLTVSLAFVLDAVTGIDNGSNLLFAGVIFDDDSSDSTAVSAVCGVGVGLLTSKINFASGSFIVVESHTKPGVIFPLPVNNGRELRSKRKRNAFKASSDDRLSIVEKRSFID